MRRILVMQLKKFAPANRYIEVAWSQRIGISCWMQMRTKGSYSLFSVMRIRYRWVVLMGPINTIGKIKELLCSLNKIKTLFNLFYRRLWRCFSLLPTE